MLKSSDATVPAHNVTNIAHTKLPCGTVSTVHCRRSLGAHLSASARARCSGALSGNTYACSRLSPSRAKPPVCSTSHAPWAPRTLLWNALLLHFTLRKAALLLLQRTMLLNSLAQVASAAVAAAQRLRSSTFCTTCRHTTVNIGTAPYGRSSSKMLQSTNNMSQAKQSITSVGAACLHIPSAMPPWHCNTANARLCRQTDSLLQC